MEEPTVMEEPTMNESLALPFGDVCLLLRAHAERGWLSREVLPVVPQLETGALPAEQLEAAVAYLEVMWMQAQTRAWETDSSYVQLAVCDDTHALFMRACRYHAAVLILRQLLAGRVAGLLRSS
jgi:hypothetical protein